MVRLCPQCGVVAPTRSQRCLLCELPLGANTLPRPEPPVGQVWASVWCWYRCPGCATEVPVDDFERDRCRCPACGVETGIRGARRIFDHAHAVGDLAGPDPEGRFPDARVSIATDNPFKAFGVLQSVSEDRHDEVVTESGLRRAALSIRVAPGHPLCDECNAPLDVACEVPGVLSAHCPGCALRFRALASPDALAALGAVRGVLSVAHREDRPLAAEEDLGEGAAPAFRCPDCTSTLGDPGGRRTLTCEMCRLVCRVPPAWWRVRPGDSVALQRAWVLFDGPSRMRDELTRAARKRAEHGVRTTSSRPPAEARRSSTPPTPTPTPPPAASSSPPPPERDAPPQAADQDSRAREARAKAIAERAQAEFAASFAAAREEHASRRARIIAGITLCMAMFVVGLVAYFTR